VILKDMFPAKCAICGQVIAHPTEAYFFPKAQLVTHQVCFVELAHKCLSPPLDPAVFDIFRTLGLIDDEQDVQEPEVIIH